jgi:hypothetical protein
MKISLAFAVLLSSACAIVRPAASGDFADRVVQQARSAEVRLGSSALHLGTRAESLPAGCFPRGSRSFECSRGGQPDSYVLRIDRSGAVSSIIVYRQSGPVDFTCRVFRSLETAITGLVGAQPTLSEGKCECANSLGCADGDRARREWTLQDAQFVFVATRNPERLIAPDGSELGELELAIQQLPTEE